MIAQAQNRTAGVVDPLVGSSWDSTVASVPQASFFHGSLWARILTQTYGFSPLYLKTGNTDGLLPLMEANSLITGRRGISLPFTDECDAVGKDTDQFSKLYRAAICFLSTRKWRYLELRGGDLDLPNATVAAKFHGHEIRFNSADPGLVFANCSKATRGAVKKAEKSGVIVEFSRRLEDMQSFYALLCETRKRHGNPPQPYRFFEAIHRFAIEADSGHLLLAKYAGKVVAGAVFLHSRRSAIYKYAASDSQSRHLSASNLVLWRALKWYVEHGFSRIQLGRTSLNNDGLRRFKLSWGSREYILRYHRYTRNGRQFVSGSDKSSGWQNRIFRLLPQAVSRQIGAVAYRHVA